MMLARKQIRVLPTLMNLQNRTASNFSMIPAESTTVKKEFWSKNKELGRPISPHLGIYKLQMTTTLSIFHRITGAGVGVLLYGGGIGSLVANSYSFPEFVQAIQDNVHPLVLLGSKTAIGGAIIYHSLCGVRHLVWDMGYGFKLKHLYLSGVIVIALTGLGTCFILVRG